MLAKVAPEFLTDFLLHYLRQQSTALVQLPERQGAHAPIAAALRLFDVQPLACFLLRNAARMTRFQTSNS